MRTFSLVSCSRECPNEWQMFPRVSQGCVQGRDRGMQVAEGHVGFG